MNNCYTFVILTDIEVSCLGRFRGCSRTSGFIDSVSLFPETATFSFPSPGLEHAWWPDKRLTDFGRSPVTLSRTSVQGVVGSLRSVKWILYSMEGQCLRFDAIGEPSANLCWPLDRQKLLTAWACSWAVCKCLRLLSSFSATDTIGTGRTLWILVGFFNCDSWIFWDECVFFFVPGGLINPSRQLHR